MQDIEQAVRKMIVGLDNISFDVRAVKNKRTLDKHQKPEENTKQAQGSPFHRRKKSCLP